MNDPYRGQPSAGGFDLNQPTIISLLYLGGFISGGVSGIVGGVLAFVWSSEPKADWERSHYTYHIRTFWIAVIGTIITVPLLFILIGFLTGPLVTIWITVRTVLAMIAAQKREAMPKPETLLF